MTELTLIIGDAASGKNMLAAYMVAQMRAQECAFIGDDEIGFSRRLAAARFLGPNGATSESVQVCDDFPTASYYRRVVAGGPSGEITFAQSLLASRHHTAIMVLSPSHRLATPDTRGSCRLYAMADTVVAIARSGDGVRRVTSLKEKRGRCRWSGLYATGVHMIGSTHTAYLYRSDDQDDGA